MPHISSFAILYIDKSEFDLLTDTTQVIQFTLGDNVYEVCWDHKKERVIMYDNLIPDNVYYTFIHPDISQYIMTPSHILTALGFDSYYTIKMELPVGVITNVDNYLDTPVYDLPLSQFSIIY
jgi:hypothetical protein